MRCTTLLWAGIAPNGNQASSRSPISIESGDLISREIVPPARVPHIVGYQCAGKIVKMGAWVRDRKVGQRVVTIVDWGTLPSVTTRLTLSGRKRGPTDIRARFRKEVREMKGAALCLFLLCATLAGCVVVPERSDRYHDHDRSYDHAWYHDHDGFRDRQ
jgi:hypothetical protein